MENWKTIPGFAYFEASDLGRIRSKTRQVAKTRYGKVYYSTQTGQIIKQTPDNHGYLQVYFSEDGKKGRYRVHKLIMSLFGPSKPDGKVEILHKNGNKNDCSIENLKWGTHSENMFDKVKHGVHHNSNKAFCPLKHLLEGANLVAADLKRNKRSCRSCTNARSYISNHSGFDFETLANQYYAKYMAMI